jgi:hypothetical protein
MPNTEITTDATQLQGLITERHFDDAEAEFPGISAFYARCTPAPATFLELVTRFGAFDA